MNPDLLVHSSNSDGSSNEDTGKARIHTVKFYLPGCVLSEMPDEPLRFEQPHYLLRSENL